MATKKRDGYISWDEYFMGIALLSAKRSKDPGTQVGACIVNQQNKIVGAGYNGFPIGCHDDILPWDKQGDFLHTKYFIKNELIDTGDVSEKNLKNIIEVCLDFFQKYLPESEAVQTEFGWDIEWKGYELGSYGIRSCEFLDWIYATGVAEPRFSSLINLRK